MAEFRITLHSLDVRLIEECFNELLNNGTNPKFNKKYHDMQELLNRIKDAENARIVADEFDRVMGRT